MLYCTLILLNFGEDKTYGSINSLDVVDSGLKLLLLYFPPPSFVICIIRQVNYLMLISDHI